MRFVGASVAELLRRCEHAVVDLAEIAARREHEHDAMAGVRRARERAAGEDRLVVGMRVEGHERAGHPPMVAQHPGAAVKECNGSVGHCYRFGTAGSRCAAW